MPNATAPININQLKPGETIFVTGKVKFSHITKHVEGEELRKANERRTIPIEKPHTFITVTEAAILPKVPGQLTPEEQYVQQKFYVAKDNQGKSPEIYDYQSISKSPYLPQVSQCDATDPKICYEIKPETELGNGLNVTLVLRIYATKQNNGLGLDGILVREPIRYYEQGRNFAAALATRGITMNALPPEQKPIPPEPAETAPSAGISGPEGDPYSSATANVPNTPNTDPKPPELANAMNIPTEPAPVADGLWLCSCGHHNPIDAMFCGKCGTPKPADSAPQQETQPGIMFTN